jgi:thiamine biosynthesis lipoprotein
MFFARLFALTISCLAAAGAAEKFSFERPLMGTKFSVICYAESRAVAAKAVAEAFLKAEQVNEVASDYLPESELSQLAIHPIGKPIPLSPILYEILDHSRRLAEATDGAFDPTLGPLTKLWRETRSNRRLPDTETLRSARASVGWRHFTLDAKSRTITLHREKMGFDLGGIAKGYAADLMLETLVKAGISRALITAGGDVRLGDAPPGRDGWKVAVKTFDLSGNDEILTLSNAAVSTSGDLHQSVEIDGLNYSHILDPATGLGLTRRIAASVIADNAKLSDALATAACVQDSAGCEALRKMPGVREVRIRILQCADPQ